MPDIQDWLRNHRAQWKPRQPRAEQNFVPRPIFGEEDAATEWEHNLKPEQIFAPIASYEEFTSRGALFLFGRRGTGKTALLHMLAHQINTGGAASSHYSCAALIQPEIAKLLPVFRGARLAELEDTDLLYLLRLAWHWLIAAAAYIEIARREPALRVQGSEIAGRLHKALDEGSTGPDASTVLLGELFAIFEASLRENSGGSNQLALTTIALHQKLGSPEIRLLENQVRFYFEKHRSPILILIETEEVYRIDDRFASAIHSALIDELLEIYKYYPRTGMLAKAAFPSEIYPYLAPSNIEKIENKTVFILWRYRDLVTLAAKRFYRMKNHNKRPGRLEKELKRLDAFNAARDFLSTILPPGISTRNNVFLDTLSYITRHTQKKPRQFIAIFNCLLTMAEDTNLEIDDLAQNEELVRMAVHSRLDTLVGGALDIYSGIYPGAAEIVKKAMTGMPCYFTAADLDKAIKQTNEMRDPAVRREDVRQLLVQSGVVGLARGAPSPFRGSEPTALMMEALFEYQFKNKLLVTANSVCVIHPMFYEELQIQIDSSVLAYPQPTEEEEELLLSFGWVRHGG